MGLLTWFLFKGVRLAEFTGQTFINRQELLATTIFRRCTFQSCWSLLYGGAVYVFNASVAVAFVDDQFINCRSASSGGSLWISYAASFSLNNTVSINSSAGIYYAFGIVSINSTSVGKLEVHRSSIVLSRAGSSDVLYLVCAIYKSGSTSEVESGNSSFNKVTTFASGLQLSAHYRLSLHFYSFVGNAQGNVVLFGTYLADNDISCLKLYNNSCRSDFWYPGLLCVNSLIKVSDSVFQANAFDYFVGTYRRPGYFITFIHSVFDFQVINATNDLNFSTSNCVYAPRASLEVISGKCPWSSINPNPRTPAASRPPATPSPTSISGDVSVLVDGSGSKSISLMARASLRLNVVAFPLFIVFPFLPNVSVTILWPDNTLRTKLPTGPVFTLHFSTADSLGVIEITTPVAATIQYFSVKQPSTWTCLSSFVSTSPEEQWTGRPRRGNFSISPSQDICLFHVSTSVTKVSGSLDVDAGRQKLYYEYSSEAGSYTGRNAFSASSNQFTSFRWSSAADADALQASFSVQLTSPSALPYRSGTSSGTSSSPILISDVLQPPV